MEANEPEPDVIAHAALVSCWAKSKKPERARQLLEERQSKDVSPNAITYSTWAWACEKSGDGAEIQEFEAEEAECDKRADVNAKNDSGGPQSSRCRPRWVASWASTGATWWMPPWPRRRRCGARTTQFVQDSTSASDGGWPHHGKVLPRVWLPPRGPSQDGPSRPPCGMG